MKKFGLAGLLVLVLLVVVVGVAYALWEETQSVQVTGRILPPEGMFQIVATDCEAAIEGYGHPGHCSIWVRNESENYMSIIDMVVVPSNPDVVINIAPGVIGHRVPPLGSEQLMWSYAPDPNAFVTGEILFDVELTCSGE